MDHLTDREIESVKYAATLFEKGISMGQGAYYMLTGVWPIVSPDSFQKITGPKTDMWLVKTVGALISVVGAVIFSAGARGKVTREIAGLAVGSAATLAGSDIIYASKRRIRKVYLLESLSELSLIAVWAVWWQRRGRASD